MSNRRKPLSRVPVPGPGQEYFVRVGIVADRHDPGQVESARQQTHDLLIAELGSRRRTGVWWTQYVAREGERVYRDLFGEGGTDDEAIKLLQDPRALLVVAWAIASSVAPHSANQ